MLEFFWSERQELLEWAARWGEAALVHRPTFPKDSQMDSLAKNARPVKNILRMKLEAERLF